jgi:hypothetical protein
MLLFYSRLFSCGAEMTKREKLREFINKNLAEFVNSGSSGIYPEPPNFDLFANDYLQFAEIDLEKYLAEKSDAQLINCVSHLKRALDCQLDTFLHCFNLYKVFSSRNLKFEKKMEFLKTIGVFNSRTLTRLNTMRNRLEHDYEIPKVQDIEVYYDLVSAFIAVIERTILFAQSSSMEFGIGGLPEKTNAYFVIAYAFEAPAITADWHLNGIKDELVADTSDIAEFAYFFKVLMLLHLRDGFASDGYVLKQLQQF